MKNTIPVFILSSGRSGTYSFFKNLKNLENLKVNHEYLFEETLKNSVSYHMKIINEKKILEFIDKKYSLGIKKTKKLFWIDSSNALPWIIKPLKNKFKNARFVFLIRNGKKVVSSFYNKYKNVMYNKKDILMLKKYFDKKIDNPKYLIWSNNFDNLEKYFDTEKFTFVINKDDKTLTDFYLLTQCRYFIVGPSTFHWWGAWLSNFENKICVRPKNLNPSNNKDFWPEKWLII